MATDPNQLSNQLSGNAFSPHPLELYLQLAGTGNKLQACRRAQEWLKLPSVVEVAKILLGKIKLEPPVGETAAFRSLEALLAWQDLPAPWKRLGYALLWGAGADKGCLIDSDGQSWEIADLVSEWEQLRTDPDGYALALTALKLVRAYRHVVWEYLLRPESGLAYVAQGEEFERREDDLLETCLSGTARLDPPESSGGRELVGELFTLGGKLFFIADQKSYELEVPDELVEMLLGRDLGRGRLIWAEKWVLQWVEVEGDFIRVG